MSADEDTEIEEEIEFPESEVETAASESETPAPAQVEQAPKSFLDDPYEFEQCTITAQIVLLPDDGHECGREVMIGVRNHQDAYILQVFRLADLALPEPLLTMLGELREQLPARAVAKAMRDAEKANHQKDVDQARARVTTTQAKPATPAPAPKPAVAQKYAGKKPTADQLALFGKI